MTHSGGKPHAVGDRGQRYEVSFFNPEINGRQVLGWTDDVQAARRMADAVDAHPSWDFPWVTDRRPEGVSGERCPGSWQIKEGGEVLCAQPKGHEGPCEPQKR